jgi:Fe-S-cluster-containing hydrogenase component 2
VTTNHSPLQSLQTGRWVKLICGASYQDMPAIRCLAMLYTLAGVDCIDVAADPAVIAAAQGGVQDAQRLASRFQIGDCSLSGEKPWLMVSLNDSEDPHFRKAYFDATHCPPDCSRPCEAVCPTEAIQFHALKVGGVISDLCYGCGRCIPICPVSNIEAHFHQANTRSLSEVQHFDAIEIHTHIGQQAAFAQLWESLATVRPKLQLVSVSCPGGPGLESYLKDLYTIMAPLPIPLIWQTDGRPMSGDLGKGTTHAAIQLAQRVLQLGLPGFVQLAGGTNHYTVEKLAELNLLGADALVSARGDDGAGGGYPNGAIAGIAYGSYARKLVMPMLDNLEQEVQTYLQTDGIQAIPAESSLMKGLQQAQQLVGKLKNYPCGVGSASKS